MGYFTVKWLWKQILMAGIILLANISSEGSPVYHVFEQGDPLNSISGRTSHLFIQDDDYRLTTNCQYSIALYDSFGDGWNGCLLDVLIDGTVVLDDITLPGGSGPAIFSFTVTNGSEITTVFTPGSWICEPFYYIYDSDGQQVFYVPNNCNPVINPGQLYGSCPQEGGVEGFVLNHDGLAVAGAAIGIENGPVTISGPNGYYLLESLPEGIVELICWKEGYNSATDEITVAAGDTVYHDFTLTQPNMVINPLNISQTLNPNEYYTTSLNILNNGSGPLEWTATINYISQPILSCQYSILLYDSYGDGWNGCALDVLVNGDVVLDNITLNNGFGPAVFNFQVTTGDEITTQFIPGSWIGEPYYRINDSQDQEVWYSPPGATGPANIMPGQLFSDCGGGDWLNMDYLNGTVDPLGNVDNVPTHLSAANTNPGDIYTALITVSSFPAVGTVTIPVTMTVIGNPLIAPTNLIVELTDPVAGKVGISWDWAGEDFQFFRIKRNGIIIATTTTSNFTDILPDYGDFCYIVQAVYNEGNSIPAGPECIEWPNPDILVDPDELQGWVWTGFKVDVYTFIYNNGEGTLGYTFPEYAARNLLDDPEIPKNQAGNPIQMRTSEVQKGEEIYNGLGYPVILGAGGPDDFGYIWIDSDESGGPMFEWLDISATGTIVNGLGDDNVVGPFGFGYDFSFYGESKSQFWVNSNGCIGFTSSYITLGNIGIPTNSSTYKDFIAWMWDDLVFQSGKSMVYYQNFTDRTIVQFDNYSRYGQSGGVWVQVIMFKNGKILVLYDQLDATITYNSCTVGIQSSDPAVGLQVVYNNTYLHNDLAVLFSVPVEFIVEVDPASGTVSSGDSVMITLTYDAEGFEPGDYAEDIYLLSNDIDTPEWILQNTMHVYLPARFSGLVTNNNDSQPLPGVTVTAGPYHSETDETGLYTLFVEEGEYDVIFEKQGYIPVNINDTSAFSGSVSPIDIGMWDANYPPVFVIAEVQDGDTWCLVSWALPQGPYEIILDDGEADDFFLFALGGSWHAVKFTPSGYPATIIGGKFFVGDGSFPGPFLGTEFGVAVFDDNGAGGLPGTILDSSGVTVNNYGWVSLDWLDATIEEGCFFLAMYQRNNAPNAAPIGIDTDNPIYFKSYSKFQGNPWALSAFQDFMIRAWISGPEGDAISEAVSNNWRAIPRIPDGWRDHGMTKSGTLPDILPGYERNDPVVKTLGISGSRGVVNYYVVRYSNFDPNGSPAAGTITELTSTNDIQYNDNAWAGLPQGWYAYGVKALYNSGLYSDYTLSNIVGHLMDFEVTVNVALSTGLSPVGTRVIVTGSSYPNGVIDTILTDSTGSIVLYPVWYGYCDITAIKPGYDIYRIENTFISSDKTFNLVLSEKKYAPTCLHVDPLSLEATWCEPLRTALEENFENPEFPPAGWQSLHDPDGIGWFRTNNGSTGSWTIPPWDSFYACTNDFASSTNPGCCDYLVTPALDLRESDGYTLTFNSFYDGAAGQLAHVEYSLDGGATWEIFYTLSPNASWTDIDLDLAMFSGINGPEHFWLAFHSDDGGPIGSGWAIDNVKVQVPSPAASYIDYYVYLDDALVGTTTDSTWNFIPLEYGVEYTAAVAARYTSGLSAKVYDRFICKFLYPPRNLVGIAPDDAAILQWDPPIEPYGTLELLAEEPRKSFPGPFNDYSPTVRTVIGGTIAQRDEWDLQLAFATADNTGEAGAETNGEFFFTSIWNGNGFQKYTLDGAYAGPVSVGSIGQIRDMAWDPTTAHMFGGQGANAVFEWSFETGTQTGQFIAPTAVRALAYDPDFDGFWANNWSSTITLFDKQGVQLNSFPIGAYGNYYGFAHDESTPGGPFLWGYSQDGSGNVIVQIEIATGLETGFTFDVSSFLINGTGTAGGLFTHPEILEDDILSIGGNSQNDTYFIFELSPYSGGAPCCVPQTLLGYNLYRDGEFVKYQDHVPYPGPEPQVAVDEDLEPGIYAYTVTGVYDLEEFGFPGETGESMTEGPAMVTVDYCFSLEFKETWVHGNFDVNRWTREGVNWEVSGQSGNPSPSAKFSWDPVQTNYSFSLESYPLCAAGMTEGNIWLDYDLKLETFNTSGDETMMVQVWEWEDQEWNTVASYSNADGSFGWISEHIDIRSWAMGKVFKIRFLASGVNSIHIVGWLVDNIHVYRTCAGPDNLNLTIGYPNTVILSWTLSAMIHSLESDNSRELSGFNVYMSTDGAAYELLDFAENSPYILPELPNGLFCFIVTAVWESETDQCESAPSDEECAVLTDLDAVSNEPGTVTVYPNPAEDWVFLKSDMELRKLTVYNSFGQIILDKALNGSQALLNIAGYSPGIYLFRIETEAGVTAHAVTIL